MRIHIILLTCQLITMSLNAQVADRVFKNAKIYATNNHFEQAIAIKDGIIIYTGSNENVATFIGKKTVVNDLGGRLVLPGIHDVHMHPLEAFTNAIGDCFLSDTITDAENYIKELKACKMPVNSNGWMMGYGHNIYTLLHAKREPRLMLDEISTTVPIFVWESTSHSAWVNSIALKMLGVTATTLDPVGGYYVKNASGEPNGILLDNAGDIFLQTAIAINPVIAKQNYDGLVKIGLPLIAKNGITSFCEARTYWKQNFIQTWRQVKADNLLTARVILTPWGYPGDSETSLIDTLTKMYDKGDDMLRISEVKLYADGLTFNTTAALKQPYDTSLGFPFTRGLNYNDKGRMTRLITALEKVGYDFHIHAIGDRGVSEALDAIEAARKINGDLGARHRVTHLEMVDSIDYFRFAALNVIADMQVCGDFAQPEHWHDNDFLVGDKRASVVVPLKSIYNTGARVTLSSDYDVSSLSPFVGMQNALTRVPQELPDVESVVKAYTINGAYTMRQEDITGTLEVGKLADLIVLDRDIFSIPVTSISKTKVELTLLGGKEVYVSPHFYSIISTKVEHSKLDCIIYPETDVDDELNVRFNKRKADLFSLKIFNTEEQLLFDTSFNHKRNIDEIKIDVSAFKEGLYHIKILSSGGKLVSSQFIVKRTFGLHDF